MGSDLENSRKFFFSSGNFRGNIYVRQEQMRAEARKNLLFMQKFSPNFAKIFAETERVL
jgi:hypothetical protein